MAKHLFKPGQSGNPAGRPPLDHRKHLEAALKKYGIERFWQETIEKAKTNTNIRIALIKKLVPDIQEISGVEGGPIQVKVAYDN